MNEQMRKEIEAHIKAEKKQVEDTRGLLDLCERQEAPEELVRSCEECVKAQEAHITRCEEVLTKMVEEPEEEKAE